MPRKNQNGGGNWQSGGGRGPWGQGPGSGGSGGGSGQPPPDLEELFKRGQDRFRSVVPGGAGVILVLLVLLAGWAFTGLYRVKTEEVGVVLTFGKHTNTTLPGLHYHWPWPIETVYTPNVQTKQTMEIGTGDRESLMLTRDENIADIGFSVQWLIDDATMFLFNVSGQEQVIKTTAESVIREVVGKNDFSYLTAEGRDLVQQEVKTRMQEILNGYEIGVIVNEVNLGRIDPHRDAIESYRDVQAAKADRERLSNEGEVYANRVVPEAQGQAARIIAEGEAFKEQTIAESEGQALRFLSVYDQYKKAPEVTRRRLFLETMEDVMKGTNKVILDDNGQGVVPYLPLQELKKSTSSTGERE